MKTYNCPVCNAITTKPSNEYNRALRKGYVMTCGKLCGGKRRRLDKTLEQKKLEKRNYDMEYRAGNRQMLREKKSRYFQKTYDPAKAAEKRKLTMPRHIEYCRNPKYKAYKQQYDAKYRAKTEYGEFWESSMLLINLDKEIESRMDWTEIRTLNNVLNKKQTRRREYERLNSNKLENFAMGNS